MGETIGTIIMLVIDGWIIYNLYVCLRKTVSQEIKYDEELHQRIQRIRYLDEQLQAVEELLTDIDLSSNDLLKNFSVEWLGAVGTSWKVDMKADGQSLVTGQLRKLAEERRAELLTSLSDELAELTKHQRKIVDKTINTRKGE